MLYGQKNIVSFCVLKWLKKHDGPEKMQQSVQISTKLEESYLLVDKIIQKNKISNWFDSESAVN